MNFTNQGKKMKNEMTEDIQDVQEIKRQKLEKENSKEEMSDWEFGKGVKEKEVKDRGIRS